MTRFIVIAAFAATLGCDADDPDEPNPARGILEMEDSQLLTYRSGDRIEFVPVSDELEHRCVFLTEDATTSLEDVIASIEPSEPYPPSNACASEGAYLIHVARSDHSPFACTELCCNEVLAPVIATYFLVSANLDGEFLDGDMLVADLDRGCTIGE